MPAKNGKTAAKTKQQYSAFVGRMTGPKTESAMALVLSIGMTGAKEHAPIEYGTLIDSAFRRIGKKSTGFTGVAGFAGGMTEKGFNYALRLHEITNWKPRPVAMKKGPAWNPHATPKYLERGFTDPDQVAMMKKALGDEYKI